MKILHIIPWTTDKNLGKFYNSCMNLIDDNDWICFLDGDAIHTTQYFGKYIEEIISENSSYGLFTCRTNNIWHGDEHYQIYPKVDRNNYDINYHRKIGQQSWDNNKTNILDITNMDPKLSGVLLLINKQSWKTVNGFKEEKMLTIDNDIHYRMRKKNLKVGLMLGIYVQHWYRNGIKTDKKHLL